MLPSLCCDLFFFLNGNIPVFSQVFCSTSAPANLYPHRKQELNTKCVSGTAWGWKQGEDTPSPQALAVSCTNAHMLTTVLTALAVSCRNMHVLTTTLMAGQCAPWCTWRALGGGRISHLSPHSSVLTPNAGNEKNRKPSGHSVNGNADLEPRSPDIGWNEHYHPMLLRLKWWTGFYLDDGQWDASVKPEGHWNLLLC